MFVYQRVTYLTSWYDQILQILQILPGQEEAWKSSPQRPRSDAIGSQCQWSWDQGCPSGPKDSGAGGFSRTRSERGHRGGGFRPFNLMCFDAFWCFFLHISYFVVRCEGRGISGTHHFANAHLRLTRGGFAFRIFLIFFGYWRWRLWHFEFCTISGFHWVVLCLSQLFGKGCLNGYRVSSHIPRSGKRWCNQRNCSWLVLLAVDFSIFLLIFIVQLWYQPWKSPAQLIFTIWLFNIAMENHIF